jgi:hypothetical protein
MSITRATRPAHLSLPALTTVILSSQYVTFSVLLLVYLLLLLQLLWITPSGLFHFRSNS